MGLKFDKNDECRISTDKTLYSLTKNMKSHRIGASHFRIEFLLISPRTEFTNHSRVDLSTRISINPRFWKLYLPTFFKMSQICSKSCELWTIFYCEKLIMRGKYWSGAIFYNCFQSNLRLADVFMLIKNSCFWDVCESRMIEIQQFC